jgi:hypothetical protein
MTKMLAYIPKVTAPGNDGKHCLSFDAELQATFWSERYNTPQNQGLLEKTINADKSLLRLAVTTLVTRFAFAGIQEQFKDSIKLFGKLVASQDHSAADGTVASPEFLGGVAHTSDKDSKTHAMLQEALGNGELVSEIREYNRLDVQLYAEISTRFNQSFSAQFGREPSS